MVKYETIIRAIEQEISKSHLHLKINPQVKKTLDKFRKKTRNRKTEMGYIIDDEGNILREKKGSKESIEWSSSMEGAYKDNGNQPIHLDHNHPNPFWSPFPTCLSETDMWGCFNYWSSEDGKLMLKSITAEDSWNNSRVSLVLGDSWHKKSLDDFTEEDQKKRSDAIKLSKKVEQIHVDAEKEYYKHEDDYFNEVWDKGGHSLKTPEDLEFYHNLRRESKIRAMKKTGYWEKMKDVKKEFRKLDCRFTIEDMGDDLSEKDGSKDSANLMSIMG